MTPQSGKLFWAGVFAWSLLWFLTALAVVGMARRPPNRRKRRL